MTAYEKLLTEVGFTADEAKRIAGCRTARNARGPGGLRMAANADARSVELYVYGTIGSSWFDEGITPESVLQQLQDAAPVDQITLRINSGGGSVFDALAIYSILQRQEAKVSVTIDGIAASAASWLALVADDGQLQIAEGGMVMIHQSIAGVFGNRQDMLEMAAVLEKLDSQIATMYAARTGKSAAYWLNKMSGETWFTAAEAVAEGLADAMIPAKKVEQAAGPNAVAAQARTELDARQDAEARRREREAVDVRLRLLELDEAAA